MHLVRVPHRERFHRDAVFDHLYRRVYVYHANLGDVFDRDRLCIAVLIFSGSCCETWIEIESLYGDARNAHDDVLFLDYDF